MIQISPELKTKIVEELFSARNNFDGTDQQFAKKWDINGSVFSRLKTEKSYDGLLREAQWINLARELNVTLTERKWNVAKTPVFTMIEQDVKFCQDYAKGMMFCDDTEIGKTTAGKYLARTLKNCFYIDASQAKTKKEYIRALAKTIGVDWKDKYVEVKENIKYALKMLPNPVVIVDEFGDLDHSAIMDQKELENATVGACGWYLMGAEGLRTRMENGMFYKKVGYAELFSRHSKKYGHIVPTDRKEKLAFYRTIITGVLTVNMEPHEKPWLNEIVKLCLINDTSGIIGGLRRAESLLILKRKEVNEGKENALELVA